ncbi:uncharacterized protein LOC135080221 [Ostrinia nubilalis]|uniref:uncharacterized protein LOC135080221 n=1 Tax=Ostrinia nubilalis TaxID=29057 RepID=UPI00308239CD
MAILYHPTMKTILKSHTSIVYIIITTRDTKYKCDKGVFDVEVHAAIDQFLNRLWHKYLSFHAVVEFPYVCPDYYVLYHDKRPSKFDLYDRTITTVAASSADVHYLIFKEMFNLTKGFPLRVNIFDRFPTSITDCRNIHYYLKMDVNYTNGMCGMDAFLMHDILRYYQFKTTFPEIKDIDGYGYMYNNTVTGSLGYLLRGEFDISFNSRFMIQYLSEDKLRFLHYVSFDSVCAVLKTPDYLPVWSYTFHFFRPDTWAAMIAALTLLSVINKICEKVRKCVLRKRTDSSNIIDLVSIGLFGWYFNKRLKISVLGALCLLTSVIICSLFQGHVNYTYTTLVRYSKIKTLDELHRSQITVYTSPSFYNMLDESVQSQISLNSDKRDVLTNINMASLQRKLDVLLEIRQNFTEESGNPMMYLVHECYSSNFLSYVTRKGFPFTMEMKVYIMMLLESGLPDAYYRFTQNALGLAKKTSIINSEPRPFAPTNILELRTAFIFLCASYFISTLTLIIEIWWAKRKEKMLKNFVL